MRPSAAKLETSSENRCQPLPLKKGLSRFSARQLPPVRARQLIEDGAKNALADLTRTKPYVPEKANDYSNRTRQRRSARRIQGATRS